MNRIERLAASFAMAAGLLVAQGNPTDDRIFDQVRLKLASDPNVRGGALDVAVHDGVVRLRGKVKQDKQKHKAEKVAKKVKGVKSVVNEIVVSPT